ncbi:extracellular triacylglycerol lipase precursor [Mycena rebaudengoi]|nr:extracellular triacylglycerol lipase precursor [Mycena rebaudengoi]
MLSITFLVLLAAFAHASPTIKFGNTTLTGSTINNVEFYGAIPYAEPPIGNLRYRPPVPRNRLSQATFDASKYGLGCLQPPLTNPSSEDCLTINIFKPAGVAKNQMLPVMAWIYGGGYLVGSSSTYNASNIVAQSISRGTPIVYVSFNYRLGPLGFPVGAEAQKRGALNLGLKDQLVALKWMQDNIAFFNGDKSKVTVFGESGGSMSISIFYLNSHLKGLARAAIFESGGAAIIGLFNADHRQADWDNYVRFVPECAHLAGTPDTFKCMQGVANSTTLAIASLRALGQANVIYPWTPTIDGPGGLLPDLPSVFIKRGQFAHLPFIAGNTLDEGTFFTPPDMNSTEKMKTWMMSNYTSTPAQSRKLEIAVDKMLKLYEDNPALGSPYNTGNETFGLGREYKGYASIAGDLMFDSQRRAWLQAASKVGVKSYGYLFSDPSPPRAPPAYVSFPIAVENFGVTHTAELLYVYGAQPASAAKLATAMIDYWVSFANSLDPNDNHGSKRPTWTPYTSGRDEKILQLNGEMTVMIPDNYRKEQIDFINSNRAVWNH